MGYHACAFEVSLPNGRYRADLAAYMPVARRVWMADHGPLKTGRLVSRQSLGTTAIFECKQARSDFLKDSRSAQETADQLRELFERRVVLERQLKVHYPSLRNGDSLFQDYEGADFSTLQPRGLPQGPRGHREAPEPAVQQHQVRHPDPLRLRQPVLRRRRGRHLRSRTRSRSPGVCSCGAVAARVLELRQKPVWQNAEDACRLAVLHKIAAAGTRALNRAAGIEFEDILEARRFGVTGLARAFTGSSPFPSDRRPGRRSPPGPPRA